MTADELKERTENESEARIRPHYSIKWTRIPTVFGHSLLVATLVYPLNDVNELTRHPARVLSKVYAECVEDTLSRFVFWLTADLNIERSDLDKETRDAIRTELSKTVKPLTARQILQMNAHVNSLPDYLRAFYLEDYFDQLGKEARWKSIFGEGPQDASKKSSKSQIIERRNSYILPSIGTTTLQGFGTRLLAI